MNVVLWVVAVVLGGVFAGSGIMKVSRTKQQLAEAGMAWTDDLSAGTIKGIGVAELLGGIGMILPAAVDVAPVLVPLAASGLAVVMAGAVVVHLRRREPLMGIVTLVLFALLVLVAWGRFGPYAF